VIGTTIGNFEVIGRLGKGGMGEVWLAQQKEIRTKVAIKTLLPQISADKRQVDRFFNEAVAVSKIKHAGITKIFDVGYLATGEAYLAMEFLDGESLAARIARVGRLRPVELADVTRQIASVLEATHAQDITHRDLKPDNLFLVGDAELERGERVKVLDFGIAKLNDAGVTGSGALGTPLYMSPEQWKTPSGVDGRADVYSLGCIVFEMASGRPPFVASSVGEACTLHMTAPVPSLRARGAAVPERIDELVQRMLAKTPAERPALRDVRKAFAELEAAEPIEAFASTLPDGAASTPVSPAAATVATAASLAHVTTLGSAASMVDVPAARTTPSRLRWLIAGGATLAIAAAAIAMLATNRTSEPPHAVAAGSAAPPVVAAAPVDAQQPAAAPKSHIHLETKPASAQLTIDGKVVDNPYDVTIPRDNASHHVTVTARGFQTRIDDVTFADDRTLTYNLVADAPRVKPQPAATPTDRPIYEGTKGSLMTADPKSKTP
jgi:eukaryotic-like serine/threonine-protein kinase